jgi:hypothetical protein
MKPRFRKVALKTGPITRDQRRTVVPMLPPSFGKIGRSVQTLARREPVIYPCRVLAKSAITATSCSGSMGLGRYAWNPDARASLRSWSLA